MYWIKVKLTKRFLRFHMKVIEINKVNFNNIWYKDKFPSQKIWNNPTWNKTKDFLSKLLSHKTKKLTMTLYSIFYFNQGSCRWPAITWFAWYKRSSTIRNFTWNTCHWWNSSVNWLHKRTTKSLWPRMRKSCVGTFRKMPTWLYWCRKCSKKRIRRKNGNGPVNNNRFCSRWSKKKFLWNKFITDLRVGASIR